MAIPDNKLAPDLAAKGIYWDRSVEPEITYYFFNMKDPVVGGYTKERIALRRAMIMSYDTQEEIRVIRKSQAIADQGPIPAGVVGYDPSYRNVNQYDPALANKLLDAVGYKKGPDGYRTDPSGKPVTIVLTSEPQAISREYDELWKKSLDRIGLRFDTAKSPFSDNIKAGEACQLAMWGSAWHADYPDGENFMQLLYGPNTHQSNHACYESKAFDAMYDKIRNMPNSPERDLIFREMARQVEVDGVWKMGVSRYRNVLVYPQVRGYRYHPIMTAIWRYIDIDNTKRRALTSRASSSPHPASASSHADLQVLPFAVASRVVAVAAFALALRVGRGRGRRSGQGDPLRVSRGRGGLRPRRRRTIFIPAPSSRRSSRRCSPTTTSRVRRSSCRWRPRRCPK